MLCAVESVMGADEKGEYVLSAKTVAFHNHPSSAWVIVDGGVYDVTLFVESHPGGAQVLQKYLGQDVSELMRGGIEESPQGRKEEAGEEGHLHSAYSYKLLAKYYVGPLATSEKDGSGNIPFDANIDPTTGKPLVDWNKAILPQIGGLGDKYFTWIHGFPTADHTVKMFQNDTLETLTKCAWYVPLLFWMPVILAGLVQYLSHVTTTPMRFFSCAVVGYFAWLLFEYSLHRFVFHMKTSGYYANILHFLLHGHHHITPMDNNRVVFPPAPALLMASPFIVGTLSSFGIETGIPLLFGFAIGYLVYDMTHFFIHFGVPRVPFLKSQKSRHVQHHYLQPDVNFGISNPLFDYVFGTHYKG